MPAGRHLVVLVTAASLPEARRIARALLEKKLAACVNIVPRIESHYWWKKKIERAREFLLVIKTASSLFPRLESCVKAVHSYDVPEIIAVPLAAGNRAYLRWIDDSVA